MRNRLLLGLVLSISLAGCGGSVKPIKPPPPAQPVANAGGDQTVKVGAMVLLDGTRSSDPSGLMLHFKWKLTPPSGSKAALDDATLSKPSFVADVAGAYDLALTVDNGAVTSTPSTLVVTATRLDLPPVANAGSDRAVKVGAVVQLDGSASSDSDGDTLTYKWTLTPPTGSSAALDSATSVKPSFTADVAGKYQVTLVVNDGTSDSTAVSITITASKDNLPPVADAGTDRVVATSTSVQLDGSKSADPDGDALTYKWTLKAPAGSSAALDSATAIKPSFTADVVGKYQVTLVVNDGKVDSTAATVAITATDKPVATIDGAATAWVGDKIALSGAKSTSPGKGALTYRWSLVAPASSTAALDSTSKVAAAFTADVAGQYTATLVVNDGTFDSEPAHLAIVAKAHTLPVAMAKVEDTNCESGTCVAIKNGGARVNDTIVLDARQSQVTDAASLTYKWTVLDPSGAAVTLTKVSSNNDSIESFVAAMTGDYDIKLVVNDGFNDSAPVTSKLTLGPANRAPVAKGGPDQIVTVGDTVTLPGNSSSDPDGDPLIYSWNLGNLPVGSKAGLNDTTAAAPTFVPDVPGLYEAELDVFDGRVHSGLVFVKITARPRPDVSAGRDRVIATGATITLAGSASEQGGGTLTYAWTIKSGPSTAAGQLVGASKLQPTFTPSFDGPYVLELNATDGNGTRRSADATITAASPIARPVGFAGNHYRPKTQISFLQTDQGIESDSLIYKWSYDPAWQGVLDVIGPSDQATYSVMPTNGNGDLLITLTVSNNNGTNASTASITVFIDPSNP